MITQKKKYLLALLQLEQYDTQMYLQKASGEINPDLAKRLRWTARLKLTLYLSYLFGIVPANVVIGVVVQMSEKMVWWWVRNRIRHLKTNGLKVVAIAGSYGKTSVKHYAYELLRQKYNVVATPESFNTVLGIAKCLKWEIDSTTQVFLVEVGAYHIGDISYLLQMVQPDIGVLTGMARQHLERFGSWENIQKAKSEIGVYMKNMGGILVANSSDKAVKENVEKLGVKTVWYGGSADRNEINLDAGKKIASQLGVTNFDVKIRQVKNRFEMTTERYGMKVIDDSFSSNDKGFEGAVEYLGKQKKYTRILVTPGIVELGIMSNKIHEELGEKIVGNADYVILVGHSSRTKSIEKGMGQKVKTIYIEKTLEFMAVVKNLKLKKEPLVIIENDVTENY